ncbi:hypothetical protein [Evansella tamaricis]|uniref:Uncharacterized protein n=1 Tax=Evansella tamaricis TaxID=2069301 RepID=A0ABS6JFB8_9BACI|nr:hypothetical protein [Evansella tamaricis]MBU9712366.1 hypothetical protein [Evansella tamaricis]
MKTYFMNGHTSKGFYSLIEDFWAKSSEVFILTGNSTGAKGSVLKKAAEAMDSEGMEVEVYVHPDNGEIVEALFTPKEKLLVLADNSPLLPSSRYSGLGYKTLSLHDTVTEEKLKSRSAKLLLLLNELERLRDEAHRCFAKGVEIHEKKEEIYLEGMNFLKADKVAEELISDWVSASQCKEKEPIVSNHFFGAATAYGPINFIDKITEDLEHRVIIKGRSGSGKSTLMRKIGSVAEKKSLSVQYFPCGLDPNSLDMVVIPALKMAILDGTPPHVINPERSGDVTVDMFKRCMDPSVERQQEENLEEISEAYKQIMKTGTKYLHKANEIDRLLDSIYLDATKEKMFEEKTEEVITGLLNRLTKK